MELLVTAFEPFGGEHTNASLETLRALPDTLGPARLHKLVLPPVFGAAGAAVCAAMAASVLFAFSSVMVSPAATVSGLS